MALVHSGFARDSPEVNRIGLNARGLGIAKALALQALARVFFRHRQPHGRPADPVKTLFDRVNASNRPGVV